MAGGAEHTAAPQAAANDRQAAFVDPHAAGRMAAIPFAMPMPPAAAHPVGHSASGPLATPAPFAAHQPTASSPARHVAPPSNMFFAAGDPRTSVSPEEVVTLPAAATAEQHTAAIPPAHAAAAPPAAAPADSQTAISSPAAAAPRQPTAAQPPPSGPTSPAAAQQSASPPAYPAVAAPDMRDVQLADARAEAAAARAESHRLQMDVKALEDRAAELQQRLEDAAGADAGALQDELSQMRMSNAMLQASCLYRLLVGKCSHHPRLETECGGGTIRGARCQSSSSWTGNLHRCAQASASYLSARAYFQMNSITSFVLQAEASFAVSQRQGLEESTRQLQEEAERLRAEPDQLRQEADALRRERDVLQQEAVDLRGSLAAAAAQHFSAPYSEQAAANRQGQAAEPAAWPGDGSAAAVALGASGDDQQPGGGGASQVADQSRQLVQLRQSLAEQAAAHAQLEAAHALLQQEAAALKAAAPGTMVRMQPCLKCMIASPPHPLHTAGGRGAQGCRTRRKGEAGESQQSQPCFVSGFCSL